MLVLGVGLRLTQAQVPDHLYPMVPEGWRTLIEAESMELEGDWRVIKDLEGLTPGAPNMWSGHRLRGGAGDEAAKAEAELEVPHDGRYAIWVRYESPYGFDVHFDLSLQQDGKTVFTERFGDRADIKNFNGVWRVQGPWKYHNTDFVYQRAYAQLKKGTAKLELTKNSGGERTAVRTIDLVFITDDLALEPQREMRAWKERGRDPATYYYPPFLVHAKRPYYFRLRTELGADRGRASLNYRFDSGWRGPRRLLFFSSNGLNEYYEQAYDAFAKQARREKIELPKDELLEPGYDSGWQRYYLHTINTASILASSETAAILQIATKPDGSDAVEFTLQPNQARWILVATGSGVLEGDVFDGKLAGTIDELAEGVATRLDAYQPQGRRPYKFNFLVSPSEALGTGRWKLFEAVGGSGIYFRVPPEAYLPENAKRLGVNRSMGFRTLQNSALRLECYEGDYSGLRSRYEKRRAELEAEGLGDMSQTCKMIEEKGPPAISILNESEKIKEMFRAYLKERELNPIDLLTRTALAGAIEAGTMDDEDLWSLVELAEGTGNAAAENPVLYYHTKKFGDILFAENSARALELVEEIFPAGSRGNSGAFYPQDGHGMRLNWYDEFTLFRRRGMNSFGSEISWGLNGMPHYAGAQTQSYEGTLARALAKYHDATLGPTHLLGCKHYGYPAEFIDLASFALASHGFSAIHNFINDNFTGIEQYKAMKRAAYALGAVEDRLVGARVVPGKVALGWSETTAIWDQTIPAESGFRGLDNIMYSLERHYLYLLLRHMQLSVDLLNEEDIEEGRLSGYEALFLVGDHITMKAARSISSWVSEGGVLVASAGGGLWDEYNRPLETLKEVYGIKGARQYAAEQGRAYVPGEVYESNPTDNRLEKSANALRAKLELLRETPMDYVNHDAVRLPVLGYRQRLTAEDGEIVANFSNGGAAAVSHGFGKGKALILGFLPGITYLHKVYPMLPYGRGGEDLSVRLYPEYKPEVRRALQKLFEEIWPGMGAKGAVVSTSHPYVEANLMRAADGSYHVALVNYSGESIDALEVRVNRGATGDATAAQAQFSSAKTTVGEELRVITAIDKFEFITLGK